MLELVQVMSHERTATSIVPGFTRHCGRTLFDTFPQLIAAYLIGIYNVVRKMVAIMFWLILCDHVKAHLQPQTKAVLRSRPALKWGQPGTNFQDQGLVLCLWKQGELRNWPGTSHRTGGKGVNEKLHDG